MHLLKYKTQQNDLMYQELKSCHGRMATLKALKKLPCAVETHCTGTFSTPLSLNYDVVYKALRGRKQQGGGGGTRG